MLPLARHASELLQRQGRWQFDLQSAVIGALVAWIVAGLLFSQRKALAKLARTLWAPIAAWRRRTQASQEEKYIRALKRALRPLLLLAPTDPEAVFIPPSFLAFAPLPKTIAEVGQSVWHVTVSYAALLAGHRKVVVTGNQGSGRTTSLIMSLWHAVQQPDPQEERRYTRLPMWVDLSRIDELPQDSSADAMERIAQLASIFMPEVLPKWLLRHLKNEPMLLILDNWESLSPEQCATVAGWIAEADERISDAVWAVAGATSGYGELVEIGFMPAELIPKIDATCVPLLYQGWRTQLEGVDVAQTTADADITDAAVADSVKPAAELDEETRDRLLEAVDAGCPLWELHLRIALSLETGEMPARQAAVLERFIASRLSRVNLGKGAEEWATQTLDIAQEVLVALAAAQRIEGQAISSQVVRDMVEAHLPPKDERPRRLEGAVRKALAESGLLRQEAKAWHIAHPLFADYLTARHLATQDDGEAIIQAHLDDPAWLILSELYAGLTDASTVAHELMATAAREGDRIALLRAARWGIVADPQQAWRKALIKALAQTFMEIDLPWSLRLEVGRALNATAGAGARAFFLKMMRHKSDEVRAAALRGLGWSGTEDEMPLLAAALQDSAPTVQMSAIDALQDAGIEEAIAYLAESWPQVDETLMIRIAEALASLPAGWAELENGTQHPDLLVRRAAAHGLGLVAEPWAEERLLEIGREDMEWLVRSAAESALEGREERAERQTRIAPPPEIDQMDWLMAWAARQGLGLGVGEAARETLLRAAQEGNVDAKVLSALTLAQIGRRSDLPLLEALARESAPESQRAATWALMQVRQRYERPAQPSDTASDP